MQITQRLLILVATCVLVIGAGRPAAAQQPAPQQPPPTEQAPGLQVLIAEGELVHADAESRTFAIRTASGSEMQFRYTDATKVVGAEKGTEGLGAKTGSQLIVKYTEQGRTNIATEIEVHGKG